MFDEGNDPRLMRRDGGTERHMPGGMPQQQPQQPDWAGIAARMRERFGGGAPGGGMPQQPQGDAPAGGMPMQRPQGAGWLQQRIRDAAARFGGGMPGRGMPQRQPGGIIPQGWGQQQPERGIVRQGWGQGTRY